MRKKSTLNCREFNYVSINGLIREIFLQKRDALKKNEMTLVVDLSTDVIIYCSYRKMFSLIENLIDNCIKFNIIGGNIFIKILNKKLVIKSSQSSYSLLLK